MKLAITILLTMALLGLQGKANAQELTYSGAATCQGCHAGGPGGDQFAGWQGTEHAVAFDSASAFVQATANCLQCHTTGWDTTVANLGADDFVTINGDGSVTVDDQAEFDKKANVQCEACHGPASGHIAGAFLVPPVLPPADKLAAETCGTCHQDAHHPYIEDWLQSKHAVSDTNASAFLQGSFRNNPQCTGCHTVQGFIQFVGTTPADSANIIPDVVPPGDDSFPIVCATCHDPHDPVHEGQLRLPVEKLCVKCHNPEDAQPGDNVHHSTSSMFDGVGAVEFSGLSYRHQSPHQLLEPSASRKCVTCHVFMTPFDGGDPADPSDDQPAATGHTFEPRLEACGQSGCHVSGLADTDPEHPFNHRGRQALTDSLVGVLEGMLASASSEDSTTQTFAEALFNLQFVEAEGSRGVHNSWYAEDVLKNTISWVEGNGFTSVEELPGAALPTQFVLHQNYPNPFNPTTTIRFDLASAGNVNLVVYNALGQVVATLADGHLEAKSYQVEFNASGLSSGLYFYKLKTNDLVVSKKMLLLK